METAGWGSAGINECADDYQEKFILIFIDLKYIILLRFLSKFYIAKLTKGESAMSEAEASALNSLDLESYDVYFSVKDEGKTVTYPFGQDISTQVKFFN